MISMAGVAETTGTAGSAGTVGKTGKTVGRKTRVLAAGRPRSDCGRLHCQSYSGGGTGDAVIPTASWWWDADTMTASVRMDDVDVAVGATLEFRFATTLHHALLHSPKQSIALPTLMARVLAVKHAIDGELWMGTLPSIALNRLAATADRMKAAPATAEAELSALEGKTKEVVALHTAGGGGAAAAGLPSAALQAWMKAWLLFT